MRAQSSIKKIPFLLTIMLLLACILPTTSIAHNKVVVIPMGGDDEPSVLFAPVAVESPSNSNYSIGSLTAIDKITGLRWQRTAPNTARDWYEAMNYCEDLSLGSIDDWRLPSVSELFSIVHLGMDTPTMNTYVFAVNTGPFYWSSTTIAGDPVQAWLIDFRNGSFSFGFKSTSTSHSVRCVS